MQVLLRLHTHSSPELSSCQVLEPPWINSSCGVIFSALSANSGPSFWICPPPSESALKGKTRIEISRIAKKSATAKALECKAKEKAAKVVAKDRTAKKAHTQKQAKQGKKEA